VATVAAVATAVIREAAKAAVAVRAKGNSNTPVS
jgi:hypothetical protein